MSYLLAKYNTQTDFYFPMVKRAVVDLAVTGDWTPATGDTKVSKDGGAVANSTNNPAIASGVSWKLTITATELSCKWLTVQIVDSATKAVEDQFLTILTYGNASAFFIAPDYQDAVRFGLTALPNAAAGANGGLPTGDANARVDVIKIAGTTQTARDIGASVLLSAGTGTGQLDFTAGVVKANLVQILATALTETAGQIAAGFKQFFNIASPTSTMNLVTSVGSVTGAVGSVTGAVGSVTGNVGGNVTGSVGSLTTNNDKTGYALSAGGVTAVQSGLATSAALTTVQADTDDIQTRIPAALVSGRMDSNVSAMAAGVVTAAAVATNAIDADALATDAVTEIAAGVAVGSAPTAAQVADAVWDEAIAGHLTAGSTGAKLNSLSGASGSGAITVTGTITSGGNPVDGAAVWITSDAAGNSIIASGVTDALGHVTVFLDAGTYYKWAQRGGTNFANGVAFTVS